MSGPHADHHAPRRWQGLLVSVRDASEASDALAGGASIIDVKEPGRGPLGAADADVAAAVAALVAGAAPWTLACGELAAGDAAAWATRACRAAATLPVAAKAGPAGLSPREWRPAFAAFAGCLPVGVEPVAVAYADWRRTAAPDPAIVIGEAAEIGCRTLLIDTGDKAGPGLLADADAVADWIAAAHAAGMAVAAAGRLTLDDIARARGLGADVAAVRGAVCRGGRSGVVDRNLVRAASTLTAAFAGLDHLDPGRVVPGASSVKPLEVRIPHGLDKAEVRRRLDRAVVKARDEYADQVGEIEASWQGEDRLELQLTVMGMQIDSTLDILPAEILVSLELPALAGMFAGKIREGITQRLGGLLAGPVV